MPEIDAEARVLGVRRVRAVVVMDAADHGAAICLAHGQSGALRGYGRRLTDFAAGSRWLVFCGEGCQPVAMKHLLDAPGGGDAEALVYLECLPQGHPHPSLGIS